MKPTLLSSLTTPSLELKNRVFMAPMTRSRAIGQIPSESAIEYYVQRASAGLIFTEATQISSEGVGYVHTPGIYTDDQVAAWKKITSAVHKAGGKIFIQLWHVGRASHPDFHDGKLPPAPSAIGFEGQVYTYKGQKSVVVPRALTVSEIKSTVQDYKAAAKRAKDAGFDGVEIHGANGYLPNQFLEDGSNKRNDEYGGSIENRSRFLLEITDAVKEVWDAENISVRISPRNPYNGMSDSNPEALYLYVTKELEKRDIGMLHVLESVKTPESEALLPKIRKIFSRVLVANSGYTKEDGDRVLKAGFADAVAFGVPFIANPDLPERFEKNAPLAQSDHATFYGGTEVGYTDYPKYSS